MEAIVKVGTSAAPAPASTVELDVQLSRAKAERDNFTFEQDVWEQARDADAAQLAALNKDLMAEKKGLDAADTPLNEERAEVAASRAPCHAEQT